MGCPQNFNFSRQHFVPLDGGFPWNEGVKEGYTLKRRHFAVIGSFSVKTVANGYIHAAYHNKHW